jgi:hypothetical protein
MSLCAPQSRATILEFDQTRLQGVVVATFSGAVPQQDYGDRAAGPAQTVPGGTFTYGEAGEGFTPNVVVDYSAAANGISLWQDSYGNLTNVLFGDQGSMSLNVHLVSDPGYAVELYHFDLAGWFKADYTIDSVRVLSGGSVLFSLGNVLVHGASSGPGHTSFDFATPLLGDDLLILIDYSNLALNQQDNIGIDNIRFGQSPPPHVMSEPPTALLLILAFGAFAAIGRGPTF